MLATNCSELHGHSLDRLARCAVGMLSRAAKYVRFVLLRGALGPLRAMLAMTRAPMPVEQIAGTASRDDRSDRVHIDGHAAAAATSNGCLLDLQELVRRNRKSQKIHEKCNSEIFC
jgi:hypothetical protein